MAICRSRAVLSGAALCLVLLHSGIDAAAETVGGIEREKLEAFTDRLTIAVALGDANAVDECISWERFLDRSLDGLTKNSRSGRELDTEFRRGFMENDDGRGKLGNSLIEASFTSDTGYRLLRLHERNGMPHAMFRVCGRDGVAYHDYLLEEQDGCVIAVDFYNYRSGEYLTETIRRTAEPIAKHFERNWLRRLVFRRANPVGDLERVQAMQFLAENGKGSEAIAIFNALPSKMKRDKTVLLQLCDAAACIDEETFLKAVALFERVHPNDTALLLLSLDSHIARKQFEEALACIDRIDSGVGGDQQLDLLRAYLESARGNHGRAIALSSALLARQPSYLDHHIALLDILVTAKDHGRTYEAMGTIEKRFGIDLGDLGEDEGLSDFVASPEGKRWLAEHQLLSDDQSIREASRARTTR